MADVVNDNPMNSLSANVGHQFTSVASFAWMDPVNGARNQESTIDIVLQTKTVGQRKLLTLEGEIRLDSHSHTTAERFKLETFNITVVALHGTADPTRALEPHPIRCDSMAPNSTLEYAPTTQQTRSAGFTLNSSPTTLGQVHFITSTCRTYLGSSIRASQQRAHSRSDGTVWMCHWWASGLLRFVCRHYGLVWCSSKPIIQTVSVITPLGLLSMNTPTLDSKSLLPTVRTSLVAKSVSFRPSGIRSQAMKSLKMSHMTWKFTGRRGSGSYGRKLYSAMNVVGKQIRRPSRILDMMVDRGKHGIFTDNTQGRTNQPLRSEATRSSSNP
ncbi:hypothetical protein BS47DRAFT_1335367 [Hydnum rufescens UP504]|uniref:Uncharacterized protein n=1 Tax=Hydnum rufescens UP504 TaxID=1448309 RepID=A0A9P6BAE2_9AGAM|nr:hypothetical protein BS47DRAFT_1335367 [Hydnum rufescens UP504]